MLNPPHSDAQVLLALLYQNRERGYGFWDKNGRRRDCLQAIENRIITANMKSENW